MLLLRSRSYCVVTKLSLKEHPPLLTFNFRNLLPQCRSGSVGSISTFAIAVYLGCYNSANFEMLSDFIRYLYDFVACGKLFEHIKQGCSFSEIILCEVNSNSLKRSCQWFRSKPSFESLNGFRVTVRLTTLFTRSLWMALVHWFLCCYGQIVFYFIDKRRQKLYFDELVLIIFDAVDKSPDYLPNIFFFPLIFLFLVVLGWEVCKIMSQSESQNMPNLLHLGQPG